MLRATFKVRVLDVVKQIRRGHTLTYGAVAAKAGKPLASRAVGAIMRANKDKSVPCHRVVAKNGLGGYNGLQGRKRELLRNEGVEI